ncbi:MAG: STAS domain-containing protein [Candidatus Eremiobacteraeota bacterium]|nr:STAS domain-containing protein [Candidatus Eremiobacteraeota bacterium]
MFLIEKIFDAVLITPIGEIDLKCQATFAQVLDVAGRNGGRVIVSFERCAYADTATLNALATAYRSLDSRLVLVVPITSFLRRVLAVAGFDKVVIICSILEYALPNRVA